MNDDEILECYRETANGIVNKVNAVQKPTAVTRATEALLGRIVRAGDSLATLRNESP